MPTVLSRSPYLSSIVMSAFLCMVPLVRAQQITSPCQRIQLPETLRSQLTTKYPKWKVEDVSDLPTEYREMWNGTHASECPGIAPGKYRDGRHTEFAILLISQDLKTPGAQLLLADPEASPDSHLTLVEVVKIQTASPNVIYRLPAGTYEDAEGGKKVRTPYEVFVMEQIEVGSLLYYYRAGTLHKLIISE